MILAHEYSRIQAGGGYARPALQRMQIIWALVRSGTFPNATQLARYLETSTKSIHRDIEFMRDRLLFDIRYDGSRFGYYTPAGPVRCPFCDQSWWKLLVAEQIGEAVQVHLEHRFHRPTPMLDPDA